MKEKKENVRNKSSARRKLIPAISMLTVSAIMLSTATYAWFTMSKDVEVTGLQMAATAGGSLEISLGAVSGTAPSVDTPSMSDKSWKSAIKFGDYYATIGKLKPSSTNTGNKIFKINDNEVYGGGTKVNESAATFQTTKEDSVTLTKATTYQSTTGSLTTSSLSKDEGYYVDIPMWIRTPAKDTETSIKCEAVINDTAGSSSATKNLKKAVRVAVIPIKTKSVASNAATDSELKLSDNASVNYDTATDKSVKYEITPLSGVETKIFGLDSAMYNDGKAISTEVDGTTTLYTNSLDTVSVNDASASHLEAAASGSKYSEVFNLPRGEAEQYSVGSFIVRVWLEGESTSCNDTTAGQDWNIDLHFTTGTTGSGS